MRWESGTLAACALGALAPLLAALLLLVPSLLGARGSLAPLGREAPFTACEPALRAVTAHLAEHDPAGQSENLTARRQGSSPRAHDTQRRGLGNASVGPGESAVLLVPFAAAFVFDIEDAGQRCAGGRVGAPPRAQQERHAHAPRGPPSNPSV